MSLIARHPLAVALLAAVALAGRAGDPLDRRTCTMVGGNYVDAHPSSDVNATDVTAEPFVALPDRQQGAFREMIESGDWVEYRGSASDFPPYVWYEGTVYDIQSNGNLDDFY